MEKITVVVPCYNEEESLPIFYEEMERVRKQDFNNSENEQEIEFEYIFVDDGSKDGTLNEMKQLSQKDSKARYISFSRNFGKEAAILAGLDASTGDFVTLMDVDLQDPPSLLKKMYDIIKKEGYDCVATRRKNRKGEPPVRSFFARMFYKIINKMSDVEMVDGARDYRLMSRKVVDSIISMREYNRYSKGLFTFVGFKTKWISYENIERVAGKTKWSFWKLFKYALEGITAFSTAPLIFSSIIGLLFCLVAFLLIILIIVRTLVFGDPTSGWPSMVCIIFFVSGVQLFSLGIIGQYMSKSYLEIKHRPIYIIRETEKDEE
ncbi:MAG: glycosyltransferase [Clostridium sp. 27_14]|jgi:glycosyltransferase, group 2 family|nr:MAG: glycosyltransferase [Clostridium sp. 27_14]